MLISEKNNTYFQLLIADFSKLDSIKQLCVRMSYLWKHWCCCMWLLVSARPCNHNRAGLFCTTSGLHVCPLFQCASVCTPKPVTHTWGYWSGYDALNRRVCVCNYRFLPTRLRRSLYGQSLHFTHSHSDVWSFRAFLCVVERVCLFEVCVSLPPSCSAELPLISVPSLSPPSPHSLLLFSASSLCLSLFRALCPLFFSFPFLIFFPPCLSLLITSVLTSSFHFFPPSLGLVFSIPLLPPFPYYFISSPHLSFPLFTLSCLILSLEFSLLFTCMTAHQSIPLFQVNPIDQ